MKPERSELYGNDEQKDETLVFSHEVREVIADLFEYAFVKALSFVTRLWAPEVASQPKGVDESDD